MRRAIALAAALLAACAAAPPQKVANGTVQDDGRYALRVAEDEAVQYQGVVVFDDAGLNRPANVMYGPGEVGFVVGLIAHGAILKGVREKQKTELQTKADRVLEPYAAILAGYRQKELVDATLAAPPAPGRPALKRPEGPKPAGYVIDSTPVFSLTQDEGAVVLDHFISIRRGSKAVYENTVHVVSSPRKDPAVRKWWSANQGERLKALSAQLYRESLDLALRDAATLDWSAAVPQQKTVRYLEGRYERMERADVLEANCDRAVIRTLRGWLMAVPLIEPAPTCMVQVEAVADAPAAGAAPASGAGQ